MIEQNNLYCMKLIVDKVSELHATPLYRTNKTHKKYIIRIGNNDRRGVTAEFKHPWARQEFGITQMDNLMWFF